MIKAYTPQLRTFRSSGYGFGREILMTSPAHLAAARWARSARTSLPEGSQAFKSTRTIAYH